MCLQEIQGQLCTADRQAALLKSLQTQHKLMLQHLDDAFAVVELLRAQVVDAACDDPASSILPHLVKPLFKERLEAQKLDPEVGSWECKSQFCCYHQPPPMFTPTSMRLPPPPRGRALPHALLGPPWASPVWTPLGFTCLDPPGLNLGPPYNVIVAQPTVEHSRAGLMHNLVYAGVQL